MENDNYILKYDNTDPKSIERYSQYLIGHTFREVESWHLSTIVKESSAGYAKKSRKGGLGNFIEEKFFNYEANSDSESDFGEAGVELKVTPYEIRKNNQLRAGERLVLTMIDYNHPVQIDFFSSHVWNKCKLMLIIYYLRDRTKSSNMDYLISFSKLFTPPPQDLKIIQDDYKIIIEKIKAGKANELSESDTNYLGASTKGENAEKSTVPQLYYAPDVKARKRAFCYKVSYMTYVLNHYITSNEYNYESIIKGNELDGCSFEQVIESKINQYVGETDKELCDLFDREHNNNKAQWSDLAFRMLGIHSNQAEEFAKAQIVVKSIRIEENGRIKESMSFPAIDFKKFVNEKWEDSYLFNLFYATRFLFVVFKRDGDSYRLKGCQLWNMPYHDLDNTVRKGWERAQRQVRDGVVLTKEKWGNKTIVKNNLLKASDKMIIHVRPHTQKSYYDFGNGDVFGSGTIADSSELPDGRRMTIQSFWLNSNYVLSVLNDDLKE